MKTRIIILASIIFSSFSLKAQEEVNVVLSFRPNIMAAAGKTVDDSSLPWGSNRVTKNKTESVNFNLNVEMMTKKSYYHYPVLGFSFYKISNNYSDFSNEILSRKNNFVSNKTSVWAGYGVGKYIYIYKENVFLNFKNSISLHYLMQNSSSNNNRYNQQEEKTFESEIKSKLPDTYSLLYELNPALGYRIKNFSLSVGLPLGFAVSFSEGKENTKNRSYDFITQNEVTSENKGNKQTTTAFGFNYGLELSLRYHIPTKKKEKK